MKRIKKIASLLLAMVMVFAMSVTAFASGDLNEGGDEPSAPVDEKDTYEIFQIFTGTPSGSGNDIVLSDIRWGQNGRDYDVNKDSQELVKNDVLKALQDVEKKSDTEKLAVIQDYAVLTGTPYTTGDTTAYTVPAGYYLVRSTKALSVGDSENEAYTLYVVKVTDGNLTFTPKVDVPEVDKKIVDEAITPDGKGDNNEASIGDTVNYEITATMPSERFDDYKTYYLKFVDTLSAGLTYQEDAALYLGSVSEANKIDTTLYTVSSAEQTNGSLVITVEIKDAKKINGLTKGSKIVFGYSAILNENAVVGSEGNPNTVKLVYSNDPNHSGEGTPGSGDHPTGETPDDKVVTYTTQITLTKVIGNTDDILTGAGFTLKGSNGVNVGLVSATEFVADAEGTYYKLTNGTFTETAPTEDTKGDYENEGQQKYKKVTTFKPQTEDTLQSTEIYGEVDDKGVLVFKGLGQGTYTLEETKTPEGYNTMQPKTFTIEFDFTTLKYKIKNVAATGDINDSGLNFGNPTEGDYVVGTDFATKIGNFAGTTLPSTGGIGTTIFYVIGGILVIGAGILLVTKRRMKAQ